MEITEQFLRDFSIAQKLIDPRIQKEFGLSWGGKVHSLSRFITPYLRRIDMKKNLKLLISFTLIVLSLAVPQAIQGSEDQGEIEKQNVAAHLAKNTNE